MLLVVMVVMSKVVWVSTVTRAAVAGLHVS
jgi:hypothetical protein